MIKQTPRMKPTHKQDRIPTKKPFWKGQWIMWGGHGADKKQFYSRVTLPLILMQLEITNISLVRIGVLYHVYEASQCNTYNQKHCDETMQRTQKSDHEKTMNRTINPCPAEPGYILFCKQCRSRSVGFCLDLHCLPSSMQIYSNNLDQVTWLAEN